VSSFGRNDGVGVVEEKGARVATLPLGNAGILRCAQNDDVKLTTARTTARAKARGRARAKMKYRDLSTAAAKCAAFGRDDVCYGLKKINRKNKNNSNGKSWLGEFLHSHLRRIKPRRRWGTQALWLLAKTPATAATLVRLRAARLTMMPSAWGEEETRRFRFYFAYQMNLNAASVEAGMNHWRQHYM
jgi:hypothetical protein